MVITGSTQRRQMRIPFAVSMLLLPATFLYLILHQQSLQSYRLKLLRTALLGTDAWFGDNTSSATVSVNNSVSSKSPPPVCDKPCPKFRWLLNAWPADKSKGAVVLLLKGPSSIAYQVSSALTSTTLTTIP